MKALFIVLFCAYQLLNLSPTINGLRVLGIFPHPGVSHFQFFQPIMRGLAEKGHNVTVISHFPEKNPPSNYKDLRLSGLDLLTNTVDLTWFADRPTYGGHFREFFLLYNWGYESCVNAYNSTAVQEVLNTKERYDVIIMEQFNSDCMMGLAWKLQVPVIGMSSCALMPWHYERIGNPLIPSYVPVLFKGYSDKMDFSQRLSNWIGVYGLKLLYKLFADRSADAIARQYLKDDNMPYISDLTRTTNMMFVNTHYSLSGAKPNSPAVIELGGIHISDAKPLNKDIQDILDTADHGVIYVSWGSMIRAETLPPQKRESLLKAFGAFKQRVLWKWENDTLPNQPANVFIRKWMPQREILCHPKVRVFLTHGGLLGSSEAAYCGVPVVVTPMYGDQFLNAAALADRGMGEIVHYEDIAQDTIKAAIAKALNPVSQENAKKVSFSYKNRPQSPIDTANWWVEHVAATGGVPLTKSSSTFLPGYIYYSFDVYATLLSVLLPCLIGWIYVISKCLGIVRAKSKVD